MKKYMLLLTLTVICQVAMNAGTLESGQQIKSVCGSYELMFEVNADESTLSIIGITYIFKNDVLSLGGEIDAEGEKYKVTKISSLRPLGSLTQLLSIIKPAVCEISSTIDAYDPWTFNNIYCEEFRLSGKSSVFSVEDGILLCADGTRLIRYPVRAENYADIPRTVTELEAYAYKGCSEPLPVPEGVKVIPRGLYEDGFAVIPLPESIEKIGSNAFRGYKGKAIQIPSGVKEVGENAFSYSEHLTYVFVPESIEKFDGPIFTPLTFEYTEGSYRGSTPFIALENINCAYDPVQNSGIVTDLYFEGTQVYIVLEDQRSNFIDNFRKTIDSMDLHYWDYDRFKNGIRVYGIDGYPTGEIRYDDFDGVYRFDQDNIDIVRPTYKRWVTDNPEIAEVNRFGELKAYKEGKTNLYYNPTFNGVPVYIGKTIEITRDMVAVSEIEEDTMLPDKIYDLSGRPCQGELGDQQPGIYIVRKNGKTTKQVVK